MSILIGLFLSCGTEEPTYPNVCAGDETDCCALTTCDISIRLGNEQSLDMVLIPAGDDPLGRYSLDGSFYLATTEISQSMF